MVEPTTVAEAPSDTVAAAPPVRDELSVATKNLLAACEAGGLPQKAAASLAERQRELEAAAATLSTKLELGPSTEALEVLAGDYLDVLSQRIARDSSLRTGAGVDLLVGELVGHVCAEPGVRQWLPASCALAPGRDGDALLQLRRRLLADLVALPRRTVERQGAASAQSAELRASLALLSAALSPDPLWQLVEQLAPASACDLPSLEPPPAADVATRAGQLLQRLLADGKKLDRPASYYEDVTRRELMRLRGEASLSPETLAASAELTRALLSLGSAARVDGTVLEARLGQLVTLLRAALRAVAPPSQPIALSASGIELAQAALRSELELVASRALAFAQAASGSHVSEAQARGIDTAVRFALARDEEEAKRIVRGLIIPLPRWSESILFDLNGDLPSLDRGDFRVVGDALLGYNGKRWGISGQGSVAEYDFSVENQISETTAFDGGVESWLALGLGETGRTKLELRVFGKGALFDTNHTGTGRTFGDETSVMGRGGLLASLRYQPGERFAAGLWLGGGVQYEVYDTADFSDGTSFESNNTETLGLLLNARARIELAIVPRWLVSRLRIDAQRYELTRSVLSESFSANNMSTSAQLSAELIELKTRLFLDAEVARFGGFVPSVNAGFDSAFFSSDAESYSSFVPVFGVGIRRDAF